MKCKFVGLSLILLCGCNSYDVKSLPYDPNLKDIVVVDNPKVIVADFVDVMTDEFNARKIKVRCVPQSYAAKPKEYVVCYDARRSWDFSPYLSDATIRIIILEVLHRWMFLQNGVGRNGK